MSVDNPNVVDFISIEVDTGKVVLTIADHLPWDDDDDEHLGLLREKLNTYLQFIESGELLETYPKAKDRDVIINVAAKFPLTEEAADFYRNAGSITDRMGIALRFELLKPSANDTSSETKPS
jgi:hypothetical protein